jgi:hypothetical protein
MDKTNQICDKLLALERVATSESVAAILAEIPRDDFPKIIGELKLRLLFITGPSPDDDQQAVQSITDAAEHDRQFGHLTPHMEDWYDNEIQAIKHNVSGSPISPSHDGVTINRYENLIKIVGQIQDS